MFHDYSLSTMSVTKNLICYSTLTTMHSFSIYSRIVILLT